MSLRDVADRLDLKSKGRRGWRGNCPACGYRDAFALTERGGRIRGWCASCGDRDAIDGLIEDLVGGGLPTLAETQACVPQLSVHERVERAMRTWRGAVPAVGTPAETYLASRGLEELARSPSMRWRPDVRHPETKGLYPALLALVQDAQGEPLALHRHYLTRDGRKADLDPPKATVGPINGGFALLDPIATEMVIGEGVESSASAGRLFSLPAVAAISAGNLERVVLPWEVRSILIAADHDEVDPRTKRRPGQWSAFRAAQGWQAEGRQVRVALPDREGEDFNDVWQRQLGVVPAHE